MLGIEPAPGPAAAAIAKAILTETIYFGRAAAARLRAQGHAPQLVIANNVLPHVPDLNDFVSGLATLLAPTGKRVPGTWRHPTIAPATGE